MRVPQRRGVCSALALGLVAWAGTAAGQSLTITDYTGRGFAPDVVTYAVALAPADAAKLRLADGQGQPVALQVATPTPAGPATLSFVTALPANGTVNYTLRRDGQGPPGASALTVTTAGDTLVLANALGAVKMPAPTAQTFTPAVPAHTLAAPVLAFRSGAALPWWGAGKVLAARQVAAWRVTLLAPGPVYAEVRYELDYAGGGYYHATVRLADRVPLARVSEEYDLGRMAAGGTVAASNAPHDWRTGAGDHVGAADVWELDLTQGWQPDTVEQAAAWGNGGGGDQGTVVPLADFPPSLLMNAGAYGANRISVFGLYRAADAQAGADHPGVGVTPLHNGFWRRAMDLALARPSPPRVTLRLPMTRTPPRWVETSPFCIATHDPDRPDTYARRQWGLLLGAVPAPFAVKGACRTYQARLTYGTVGLDRYKDYVLDWPDAQPTYPRAFLPAAQVAPFRAALAPGHPLTRAMAEQSYAVSGNAALVNATAVAQKLRYGQDLIYSAVGLAAQSHQRCSSAGSLVASMDDALSYPDLPAAQRRALRTELALLAYLFSDPDVTGQGSGSHTGPPNMSTARQGWLAAAVALLPDHPRQAAWRDYLSAWTAFKFADNMAPGGAWCEPGSYALWGYTRLVQGLAGLATLPADNLAQLMAYHRANLAYQIGLQTPVDPRYGARMFPGFGNSRMLFSDGLAEGAGVLTPHDPAMAARVLGAWQAGGAMPPDVPALARPWVRPQEPVRGSGCFPGFGVVLRAHEGPGETYLMLRSGFNWSHWYVDQGNLALYAKGAVLLSSQPYTYYEPPADAKGYSLYNDLRFGAPENELLYGWPDSNVLEAHGGKLAQYAWASAGYPAWFITPGRAAGWGAPPKLKDGVAQREGEFWWDRQVVLMVGKTAQSPNYFVFHDTITGDGRLAQWFNLNLLGRASDLRVQPNRLTLATEWPVTLDVHFPGRPALVPELVETTVPVQMLWHQDGWKWAELLRDGAVSRNWFRTDGQPVNPAVKNALPDRERRVLVRLPAAPGQDHLWVAYPRGAGEAEPTVTRLAPNVVQVTHAEGTDFVLLAARQDHYEGADVVLAGTAAALRVAPDGDVTFALLGGAGRVGYQGQVFAGVAPAEVTVPRAGLKAGLVPFKAAVAAAALRPELRDHQDLAPGIKRATAGAVTEYVVDAPAPVVFSDTGVRLEARRALLRAGPDGVRCEVPEGTYALLAAGAVGVRGVGPFQLTITADRVVGTVDGATRTLVVSKPANLTRPMFLLDQVRWMAGYPDDPAPYRGRPDVQFSLAFGVTAGPHTIEVREFASPPLPPEPPRRHLGQQ